MAALYVAERLRNEILATVAAHLQHLAISQVRSETHAQVGHLAGPDCNNGAWNREINS